MSKSVKQKSTKAKTKRLLYSKENVKLALDELKNEGAKIAEVARKYGIPESTLRAKKLGIYADKNPGPPTVLTDEEEKELVFWISHCSERGFAVTKAQIIESVRVICVEMKKNNPFTNNTPGRSWYDRFLKRHPEVVKCISEKESVKTKVPENNLREWFREVSQYLSNKKILSIEPNRIFNLDEAGMPLNPMPPPMVILENDQNLSSINNNIENESVTVLVAANAAGNLAPTCVLFGGKMLPNGVVDMAIPDFAFGLSENGWMSYFYEYVVNVFEPWLQEQTIERPVILYINGRNSHLTLHLSKFCWEHEIELIALHPASNGNTQPLDRDFFQLLKVHWEQTCETFCSYSLLTSIEKHQFAPLLKDTFSSMDIESDVQNRFKKCGLYPFNAKTAINRDKNTKLAKATVSVTAAKVSKCNVRLTQSDVLKIFESLLTPEQLNSFQSNEGSTWTGINKDEGLFNIWYKLSYGTTSTPQILDFEDT